MPDLWRTTQLKNLMLTGMDEELKAMSKFEPERMDSHEDSN